MMLCVKFRFMALPFLVLLLQLQGILAEVDQTGTGGGAWPFKFLYPLVSMRVTMLQQTLHWALDGTVVDRGLNQLYNVRNVPDPEHPYVVNPNFDTLYTSAWLDLEKEPVVLSVPAVPAKRFYMFQMMDLWSNVFGSIGSRTNGGKAIDVAICGPGFQGQLPEGVQRYNSMTREVWLLGRTQILEGEGGDLSSVWATQNSYKLYLLSEFGKKPRPIIPKQQFKAKSPAVIVNDMSAEEFFVNASEIMVRGNMLSPKDPKAVHQLLSHGIVPGRSLEWSKLSLSKKLALEAAKKFGMATIKSATAYRAKFVDSWIGFDGNVGNYSTDYDLRAIIAHRGLGANVQEDCIYRVHKSPMFQLSSNYSITFSSKLGTPPVKAFWSLTASDGESYLVRNQLNRYMLGSESDLYKASDGSITIYIQAKAPESPEKLKNWLPIPAGSWSITARMYWPKDAILDEDWTLPKVVADTRALQYWV
eukprot:TRINITY_DN48183_c0_g1_i1.p1 TRINITY_DN48183_c0_g1~~TRINITY_DN48183_c0_g1_i1.p1  ORF type:complete len:474 (+),score=73.65 TRINITY_DN48183_c0_g1_i1:86-1507(+)